jgi:SAM-dependent methyltransferase
MEPGFDINAGSIFTNPFYFIRKGIYQSLKRLSQEVRGDLLDFGCGSKPYQRFFSHCDSYIGLDMENPGHPHKNEHIDVYYDGKKIPFPDDHFDVVFASEVFEHVFGLEETLKEIRRVLKPGGKLLFTCPFVWPEHERPYDFARYSSFGIAALTKNAGFEILIQEKTGHFFEVILQQLQFYIFCFLPKRPAFIYYILHQVFILPFTVLGIILNLLLPKFMKRKDLFHNNVLLADKSEPSFHSS